MAVGMKSVSWWKSERGLGRQEGRGAFSPRASSGKAQNFNCWHLFYVSGLYDYACVMLNHLL